MEGQSPGRLAHPSPQRRIQQSFQAAGPLPIVGGIVEHVPVQPLGQQLAGAGGPAGDDRQPAGGGLQHDQSERIVERGEHQGVGGRIIGDRIVDRAHEDGGAGRAMRQESQRRFAPPPAHNQQADGRAGRASRSTARTAVASPLRR